MEVIGDESVMQRTFLQKRAKCQLIKEHILFNYVGPVLDECLELSKFIIRATKRWISDRNRNANKLAY